MRAGTTGTVLFLLAAGVGFAADGTATPPPVYLTIVSHNEEPGAGRPDYTADPVYYLQNRGLLKLLAETIASRGAAYNFQSDWNYLKAVAMYDAGSVTGDTAGKNIIRWMREDLGVEVDPHAHETQYNYADVAFLFEQLGVAPSKSVGGFLYDPPDNPQGWEQHVGGIDGRVYPSYFWRADLLWGAGTYLHQGNDDRSSGVWRPRDRYNFYVDDPDQRLLYIGGGCGGQTGLLQLLADIQEGRAPADGFYTANLMMIQDYMTSESIAALGAFIDSLAPYVSQGRVRWTTLSRMADIWRTEYGSRPFRHDCAATTDTTYTTETFETWVAAPNGNLVYTRVVQPVPSLYPGRRFPALIAIPGGTGSGAPLADNPGYRSLAASGFVVVAFNPEGRGSGQPGNLRSQGTENCNGFIHQDDLKAVAEFTASRANVNPRNVGVETASFGIAIGAGALGRYPTLPVAYLVDQEGPHDNRVITFYDVGRETAVCGHWSTVTDPSPANVAWWVEREAVRHIGNAPGMYLRMQAEIDHAQGPGYFRHAIEMVNAATHWRRGGTGLALWTRMNGSDIGNPVNLTYPPGDPSRYPAWVSGRLADHPGLNLDYDRQMSLLANADDFDADGDVDLDDDNRFVLCYTGENQGPIVAGCEPADFDLDGDVDCTDWNRFVLSWTGPGSVPGFTACPAPAPAGRVPDGDGVPGAPLTVSRAPRGDLTLSWGVSCSPGDDDYEIYEGVLGDFTSHAARFCGTGGVTTRTFTPAAGSRYYLVVPRNDLREGSYGRRSDGSERPGAASACLPREIASACP